MSAVLSCGSPSSSCLCAVPVALLLADAAVAAAAAALGKPNACRLAEMDGRRLDASPDPALTVVCGDGYTSGRPPET
ncbi:hypothetical protein CH63R_06064 [Colletotrichum higginsianum IMI 349063]|uniref:Secreted protein n=1 Tax=Colletotrichum higginsianum (strain IMI 349063) TaxID=759273 RepID=A0A1B7YEB1_COLHI|nr:hypothetical protein CH63R_06064 [Colletotrichum higginsianum IMI 349063]OBR10372.1 hypothetical protein CH63R_06064 [Colletotrichum higginsianum IMI 349063]